MPKTANIQVRQLCGAPLTLALAPSSTVAQLKAAVAAKASVAIDSQRVRSQPSLFSKKSFSTRFDAGAILRALRRALDPPDMTCHSVQIVFSGRELDNQRPLSFYGVAQGGDFTMHLVLRTKGM